MSDSTFPPGLYIVATPIGNLSDLSPRAADVLKNADRVLAEDKRVTAKLLRHIGADTPMTAYHDHSDDTLRDRVLADLGDKRIALVSEDQRRAVRSPVVAVDVEDLV